MAKYTLKILRCSHRKIFKVCSAIFQHFAWKDQVSSDEMVDVLLKDVMIAFTHSF